MKNDLLIQLKGYQYIRKENTMGLFYYADYIDKIFELVIGDKIIQNYMEIYRKIENKEIKNLTLDEIVAYFTFIRSGERFCDGHIAKFLDNGIFKELFERYLVLC